MKDNLFEILMTLFEKTLTQLKDYKLSQPNEQASPEEATPVKWLKTPADQAVRIFTDEEQRKLTKASYQYLLRLQSWGIIGRDVWELIINQLILSDSDYVSLNETKWMIRKTLAPSLSHEQLAFLDLLLYQKEDQVLLH